MARHMRATGKSCDMGASDMAAAKAANMAAAKAAYMTTAKASHMAATEATAVATEATAVATAAAVAATAVAATATTAARHRVRRRAGGQHRAQRDRRKYFYRSFHGKLLQFKLFLESQTDISCRRQSLYNTFA
jgi:hypothetical protein